MRARQIGHWKRQRRCEESVGERTGLEVFLCRYHKHNREKWALCCCSGGGSRVLLVVAYFASGTPPPPTTPPLPQVLLVVGQVRKTRLTCAYVKEEKPMNILSMADDITAGQRHIFRGGGSMSLEREANLPTERVKTRIWTPPLGTSKHQAQ